MYINVVVKSRKSVMSSEFRITDRAKQKEQKMGNIIRMPVLYNEESKKCWMGQLRRDGGVVWKYCAFKLNFVSQRK